MATEVRFSAPLISLTDDPGRYSSCGIAWSPWVECHCQTVVSGKCGKQVLVC